MPEKTLTPDRISSLAAAAVAAPSADNRHVFRLEADGDSLRVLPIPELVNAPQNRRILGLISIGAAVENIGLRARSLGLSVQPAWQLGRRDGASLGQLTFREQAAPPDPLEQAIERRHTNRRVRFRGPRLAPQLQQSLSAQAAAVNGTALIWLDEPARRRRALQLIRWAEAERFCNEALHRELFEAIRFDAGWNVSVTEGLPPASLELPWFERPAFSMLRHWRVQRIANLIGTHRMIGFRAADLPCRLAPHLCAVSSSGELDTAALNAGRLLQRVWLHATTLGLSVQVFAASPLYAHDGADSVDRQLRSRLASGWQELSPRARPFIVFRMGHARPPTLHAGRLPPQSLLRI